MPRHSRPCRSTTRWKAATGRREDTGAGQYIFAEQWRTIVNNREQWRTGKQRLAGGGSGPDGGFRLRRPSRTQGEKKP